MADAPRLGMTTLVTGAGLIGCLTAKLLAERGERVLLLDSHPQTEAVAGVVGGPAVTLLPGDVTDLESMRCLLQAHGVGAIVHTAALLSTAIRRSPLDGVRVNVLGTAQILELAREAKLRRVVLASSTTVGYPAFAAFDAAHDGPRFPEDFTHRFLSHRPASIYAASKCFCEQLALLYRDLYGVSTVALRYAAVIGAWGGRETSVPGRLLSTLIGAARQGRAALIDDPLLVWKGGEEFVDARDCARANVAALDADAPLQGVYQVGDGAMTAFDDVIAAVRELYPSLDLRVTASPTGGFAGFPHPRPAPSDLSAAARELGWSPRYTVADAVAHYAPWFA